MYGSEPRISTPQSIQDLLNALKRDPSACLCAGGTFLLAGQESRFPNLPERLIYIKNIDELNRIHRTERFLEIGACSSISRILNVGARVIPLLLSHSLRNIGTPAVQSLATLGGNICVPDSRMTAYPALLLLDTLVELREAGGSRWIPIGRLVGLDGSLNIQESEVLTRIRIPLGEWNLQIFRSITPGITNLGSPQQDWSISFYGLADTGKGTLSNLRLAFGSMGKTVIRNREIEAEMENRRLPIPKRDIEQVLLQFLSSLESHNISPYQKTILSLSLHQK